MLDLTTLPQPQDLGEVLLRLLARPAVTSEPPAELSCPARFRQAGDLIVLVGAITTGVAGAEYLVAEHGDAEAGERAPPDPVRERAVEGTVRRAVAEGLLASARACARGGLAVALARCCVHEPAPGGGAPRTLGAALRIPFPGRKDFVLFGEDAGRVVASLRHADLERVEAIAQLAGAPLVVLGAVGGERLEIQSALSLPVAELQAPADAPRAIAPRTHSGPSA